MNIGLVRHFKVSCTTQKFMTSDDFEKWTKQYDISDIVENSIEFQNIKWSKCFSSDLPRAVKTAETIFKEKIITTHLLREVSISPVFKSNFKFPYVFWCIMGRLAWLFNHKSQPETKKMTTKRIHAFLDTIEHEADHNVLVVCHGFFMHAFQKELKSSGFSGKSIKAPQNGTLYLYKK